MKKRILALLLMLAMLVSLLPTVALAARNDGDKWNDGTATQQFAWNMVKDSLKTTQETDSTLLSQVTVRYGDTTLDRLSKVDWNTVAGTNGTGVTISAEPGYKITSISIRCNDNNGVKCSTYNQHQANMETVYNTVTPTVVLSAGDLAGLWKKHINQGMSGPHWLCISIAEDTSTYTVTYQNATENAPVLTSYIENDIFKADALTTNTTNPQTNLKWGASITADSLTEAVINAAEGYSFSGWKVQYGDNWVDVTTETGKPILVQPNETVAIHGNTRLIAQWEKQSDPTPTTYTITYDEGDVPATTSVTGMPDKVENVEAASSQAVSSQTPTRGDGYEFNGWSTADIDQETKTYSSGESFIMPAKNVTFTALWKQTVPQPTPAVTEITKEVVKIATSVPAGITGIDNVTYPKNGAITLPAGTTSVTLLYKVTVSGDPGASYAVTDSDATCVSNNASGTIPATGGDAVLYFTKTFSVTEGNNTCTNIAMIGTALSDTVSTTVTVEEEPVPEKQLIVQFNVYNGSWADGAPATNVKSYTLSSASADPITAPAVTAPEGKVFDHWVSNTKSEDAEFQSVYTDYDPVTDYAVTVNTDGVNVVTWTAVYKDAVPPAPVTTDLEKILADNILVQCTNHEATHGDMYKFYGWIKDGCKIGNVVMNTDGDFICPITVESWMYATQYNKDTGVQHPVTVPNVTFNLVWKDNAWTVNATDIPAIKVNCHTDTPIVPDIPKTPVTTDLLDLLDGCIVVECVNEDADHLAKAYGWIKDGCTIGTVALNNNGEYICPITVNSDMYVAQYNTDTGVQHPATVTNVTFNLVHKNGMWTVTATDIPIIKVNCHTDTPIVPDIPKTPVTTDLLDLLDGCIVVECVNEDADHLAKAYGWIKDGCTIGTVVLNADGEYICPITVNSDMYVAQYNKDTGVQHPATVTNVTFNLVHKNGAWTVTATDIPIIKVNCHTDTPVAPPVITRYTVYTEIDKHGDITPTKTYKAGEDAAVYFTVDRDYYIKSVTVDGVRTKNYSWDRTEGAYVITFPDIDDDHTVVVTTGYDGYVPDTPSKPSKPSTPSKPTVKPELNTEDHVAYIIGYEDGTVHPEDNISRAEVATIFFRLLTSESRTRYWSQENGYSDVAAADWYNNAVSTLDAAGVIVDAKDGLFRPGEDITRAEFAVMAAQFSGLTAKKPCSFSDVPDNYWAAEEIAVVEQQGWITGYPEGIFKPDATITRCEAMVIINRMLERAVDEDHMLKDMVTWSDNLPGAWYYEAVQEATNSHSYVRTDKKVSGEDYCYEDWQKILENPDWAALEKAWSTANS